MQKTAYLLMLIFLVNACSNNSSEQVPEAKEEETPLIAVELKPGVAVSQSIKGGEAYLFEMRAEANSYFHIQVIQKNIDLKLVLHLPESDSTQTFDSPNGLLGTENIHHLNVESGMFQVEVAPLSYYAEAGEFTIEIKILRPASEEDQKWMTVYKERRAADQLRAKSETREQSIPAYEAVIKSWQEIGDKYQEADATRALGFTTRNSGQSERAIEIFTSLIPKWQELGQVRFEAFTYIILAGIYKNQKDFETALDLSFKGIEKWQEAGDLVQETKATSDVGSFYMMTGEHEKAKTYYQKILEMAKVTGSLSLQGTMYRENGNAWQTFGDKDKVIEYYAESLECYVKMGHKPAEALAATILGDYLTDNGDKDKAISYYQQALKLREELGHEEQIKALKAKLGKKS